MCVFFSTLLLLFSRKKISKTFIIWLVIEPENTIKAETLAIATVKVFFLEVIPVK